jgi:TusA-related sulfurtransferase
VQDKPDFTIDFRQAFAPIALLDLKQFHREMQSGQTIEVYVSDEETKADIFRVLRSSFYKIIRMEKNPSYYRILMQKN